MTPAQDRTCFGEFHFDASRLRLSRGDQPVAVSGLPLRILEILLASDGRVVSRAEFKQRLWPYAHRIDTERRLNTAIRALREALGDSGIAPQYIATIRGRGYRWVGGDGAAATKGRQWRLLPIAWALLLTIGGSSARLAALPSVEEQASLVRLASATDRQAALAGVLSLVEKRPEFAEAQMLRAQLSVEAWRSSPDRNHLSIATNAIVDALAITGQSSVLQTFSAELELTGRWDWIRAERLYRSALDSDPDNVEARRGLAWLYVNSGRNDEAWAQIGRLLSVSSLTAESRADLGWLLLRMDRADVAASVCRDGTTPINLLACRHTAMARLGRHEAAREATMTLMAAAGADPAELSAVRRLPGQQAYRRFLDWRAAQFQPQIGHWFQRAQVQAEAGRHVAALNALDRAFAARDPLLVKLASTPEFRPLHGNPRYRALLEAVTGRRT
jgi:DNA-binding winged helix-turn-helix (wHTH) protein